MRKAIALLVFFVLSACGGDGSNDAPEKCEALVSQLCARGLECSGQGTIAECVAAVHTEIPCAQADAVSDGYAACMSELAISPCSILFAGDEWHLPATCKGAILFRQ